MSEPTTSMREALEAAFEDAGQALPTEEPVAAPEPAVEADPAASAPAAEGETSLSALAEGDKETDNNAVQQPERDEQGKFKAKEEGITPGPKSGPRQQPEKAPASWKPEVREHWAQLPESVRSEIYRREVEVQRTLQETAEARKTAEAVMKTVAPYEGFIRAEGSNPIQAIDNLMATAARLRTGTAPELAQLVAGLVTQFGTGRFGNQFIEMLDSALAGQAPQAADTQTAQVQQAVQQQLAPVQQFMTQFQQMQAQQAMAAQQQAANEVQQFLSQAEFGDDVRDEMADLLEAAQRKGQNLTLQQAYEKACYLNDSVRKVMQQRQVAQRGQVHTQAAQRAKAAAVSVSGSAPMGALQQSPTDVRSAIEAAIQMSSR